MDKQTITAIIVDDEPRSVANLQHFLATYCPAVQVIASATDTIAAAKLMNDLEFDVAFLDIEILDDNIFNVLSDSVKPRFEIVFVTAHDKYAVKAFRIDALDYILKPLAVDDITHCYQKLLKHFNMAKGAIQDDQGLRETGGNKKVILKQGENVYIIKQEDIHYLKAKGFYTEVYFFFSFTGKILSATVSKPISTLENEYNSNFFFRVHKSYIVNVKKVTNVVKTGSTAAKMEDNTLVPVAKRRINDFITFIDQFS